MVVVVSHLFLFLGDKFRGRCDSHESHLPLCGTIYFPTAPFFALATSRSPGLPEALAIAYNSGMYFLSLLRKRSCLPFLYVL